MAKLVRFELEGVKYPLVPKNAFYDWLYIRALESHADWIEANVRYDGYTDIEFSPQKQVNCQARAFSEFLKLINQNKLHKAVEDFKYFSSMLSPV